MRSVVERVSRDSLALLEYLEARGHAVRLLDSGPAPWPYPPLKGRYRERLDALRAEGRVVTPSELDPSAYDALYVDLYTSPLEPFVAAALDAGRHVSGLADVVLADAPCRTLGVTGSAGKSSTTMLAAGLFARGGLDVHVVGDRVLENTWPNHELVQLVGDPSTSGWLACELTSAHLEYCHASPTIAVITNIFRDHVEWHGTLERYVEAKARILAGQRPDELAIVGLDDEGSRALAARARGRLARFSREREVEEGAFLRGDSIVLRWEGRETELCRLSQVAVAPSYAGNVLAATAAAAGAGVEPEAIADGLRAHRGLPARLEHVGRAGGVSVYNDGGAMTPAKVQAALEAFPDGSLVYIGGGNLAFDAMGMLHSSPEEREALAATLRLAAAKARSAVVYGPAGPTLGRNLADEGLGDVREVPTLAAAIETAGELARTGDTILFSPLYYTDLDEVADFNRTAWRLVLDPREPTTPPAGGVEA